MLCKRLVAVLALFSLAGLPAFAGEPAAKPADKDGVRVYEVRKGDTLWGISQKFIDDPYYWPDLWANNPEILNPHFIYPGQKLQIYGGPVMVVGTEPAALPEPTSVIVQETTPAAAPAPAPVPAKPEPVVTVTIPAGVGFISADRIDGIGMIYDFVESRRLSFPGDEVFIRTKPEADVKVGDRLEIFTVQNEILHPVTKRPAGYRITDLGALEVTGLHKDVKSARIKRSYQEIERGAFLMPVRDPRQTIELKRAAADKSGVIIASSSNKALQGINDVVFVDLGAKDGIVPGNLLTVTRPRQASDLVKAPAQTKMNVELPDELVGYALIVDAGNDSATAVMLKTLSPALAGDKVATQTGGR